jgi:hypothetical protein
MQAISTAVDPGLHVTRYDIEKDDGTTPTIVLLMMQQKP